MKKSVAAYWVFVLSLSVVVLFASNAETKAQLPDRILSLQELSSQLINPKAIGDFLWKNFKFVEDQQNFGTVDYWQSPQEFLENKKGDCEDFAVFSSYLLKLQGIQNFILNIYSSSASGHTICVFKDNGKYQALDGFKIRRLNADTLDELAEKIDPFWNKAAIVAPSEQTHRGIILKEIDRPSKPSRFLSLFA